MPRIQWPDRELRLTFSTNVLPTSTPGDLMTNLGALVPGIREALSGELPTGPFGLGLWIPAGAAAQLTADRAAREAFTEGLRRLHAEVFTLNGFPYGDFHAQRVKEDVFRPSWAEPQRLRYTLALGDLLAGWLSEGETGSISTLPCGKKSLHAQASFADRCAINLLRLAARWHRLREATGRTLVLGLEPEPGGSVETTGEITAFYRDHLLTRAPSVLREQGLGSRRAESIVRRHLGVCFDACHQAVQFEATSAALDMLEAEGIPVAKLQISSALHVPDPLDDTARSVLRRFAEPRYLHQVTRRTDAGVVMADDLEAVLDDRSWRTDQAWRIHFHVPIHRQTVSGLDTTRDTLVDTLRQVLERDATRHLEVETYTWGVLPGESRQGSELVEGLAAELRWTLQRIAELAPAG